MTRIKIKQMLLQDKQIAIIGGGPGGLTLARLLQIKGAQVKVYERDYNREVRTQGATLDLHHDSGLLALETAGLMDAFKEQYRPGADRLRILDQNAGIFFDQHREEDTIGFGDESFRPEIDRGPLRNILLDALEPDTVVWNSHITGLDPVGDSWQLIFEDGNTVVADIVIGADGAKSKIRPLVTPIKPFYSGVTILEANINNSEHNAPQIHKLLQGGKIMALGNSQTISISAKGDGSLDFYAGWKAGDNWATDGRIDFSDHKQVLDWFKKEYINWDSIWTELFDHPNTVYTLRPQYCMPLDQSWEASNSMTIIGDAAHLMPPYAGEGVNMAMLDALELSESLTDEKFPDIRSAIANYEQSMFTRFAEIGKETLDNTDFMHSPTGLKKLLRMFGQEQVHQSDT